jgi:hypothetical protein
MHQSLEFKSQTMKNSSINQIIKWISIFVFILLFLLSPKVFVSAQTSPEEVQISPNHNYLPIVVRSGTTDYNASYVSTEGNDNNPGTFSLPWRTINKAAYMVKPGSTVYIRNGVYREAVEFRSSGTSTAPIRILAYPGETAVIDGNNFTIPGVWGVLLKITGDYVEVSGLEVRYSAGMGVSLSGSYDIVDKIYSHHNKENGIIITRGHNSTVENCLVWRNALSNEYGSQGYWSSGLTAARNGVSYVTMRHNTVWENWGEGISAFEANQIIIEDNILFTRTRAVMFTVTETTSELCWVMKIMIPHQPISRSSIILHMVIT